MITWAKQGTICAWTSHDVEHFFQREFHITANKEGLGSLINLLIALSSDIVTEGHMKLDPPKKFDPKETRVFGELKIKRVSKSDKWRLRGKGQELGLTTSKDYLLDLIDSLEILVLDRGTKNETFVGTIDNQLWLWPFKKAKKALTG